MSSDKRNLTALTLRLRRWWREALNLDGPWVCKSCMTWTVVRQPDGRDLCINCNRHQCGCDEFGADPRCEHHVLTPRALAIREIEARALEMSRG